MRLKICHDSMNVAVSAEITKSGEKYLVPLGYDCGFYEMFQYPEVKKMFYEIPRRAGACDRRSGER